MTYFESRPALVDNDEDTEIVASVRNREEEGLTVRLIIRSRSSLAAGQKQIEIDVPMDEWVAFSRGIRLEARSMESL